MSRFAGWRVGLAGVVTVLALASAAAAWSFEPLPSGGQVNDDPAHGIDPSAGVSGEGPANADVVGGALTAGKVAVPWAIFRQQEGAGGRDQIFVRSFAAGAWTTRGSGTVGGSSSAGATVPDSLNFDRSQDGEAPSIDFAGAGRTVPWATWYENTTGGPFAADNIFASRFDNSGDANQGKWLFEGQGRGTGGSGPQIPSLNIHTNRDAQDPSVAGGATVAGGAPVPWITWQEQDGGVDQIFTSRAVKPASPPTCPPDGTNPATPASAVGAVATFCWQQVGVERVASGASTVPPNTADPSLNVDRTRDGVEPDIAFTGLSDSLPWVVWYEQNGSGAGLLGNKMVFAAKAVSGGSVTGTIDGGFHWQVVGEGTAGQTNVIDDTAAAGPCAASQAAEEACSLNKAPTADAEDPRIAAGTMTPGSATVPWVTWDEDFGGHQQVFVARLAGGDHFELANNGAPISTGANDSTHPDITFSQNTPYVSWREDTGGGNEAGFLGHFALDASGVPMFKLDESDVSLTPDSSAEVREPISSGCPANPFDADGSSCQGDAIGTPFLLYTNGTSPNSLFAGAYQPGAPVTGAAGSVSARASSVAGSVNPAGSVVSASFQFGPTTAYGQQTAPARVGPADAATGFTASLTGLAPNTTIHYRAVVSTDFGTFTGADRTLRTTGASGPALSLRIVKSTVKKLLKSRKLKVGVRLGAAGKVTVSASATITVHRKHKALTLGSARASFTRAGMKTVSIALSKRARSKLAHVRGRVVIKVSGQGTDRAGNKSKRVTGRATFARR